MENKKFEEASKKLDELKSDLSRIGEDLEVKLRELTEDEYEEFLDEVELGINNLEALA